MNVNELIEASQNAEHCQRNWDHTQPVPEEHVHALIDIATNMPTKSNDEFYRLVVSTDRDLNRKFYELAVDPDNEQTVGRNAQVDAPVVFTWFELKKEGIGDWKNTQGFFDPWLLNARTEFSKAGLRTLHQELADNATTTEGCGITRTAVSPKAQENQGQHGRSPIKPDIQIDVCEGKWERVEDGSKRAAIDEGRNEVIEIPARGHGRKVVRRGKEGIKDPRPRNSAEEIVEDIAGERQYRTAGKILRQPGENSKKSIYFPSQICAKVGT